MSRLFRLLALTLSVLPLLAASALAEDAPAPATLLGGDSGGPTGEKAGALEFRALQNAKTC